MKIRARNDRASTARTVRIRKPEFCVTGALPAAAILSIAALSSAHASPTGGAIVEGQGAISTPAPGATRIDQASQQLRINWNTFDIAAGENVQFAQPSSSALALNRILDQNPSQIFGRIEANGQVILVNPNGLVFGPSAQINVGSLVASSLDVVGFDAASGRYTFAAGQGDGGAIVNEGRINAAAGGSVTLLGGRVTNTGSIIADFGAVNLAAGRAATIDLAGDGLLRLEVDAKLLSNEAGASAAVDNSGVVQANGGRVLLTAEAVDNVFANLVNNTGVVRANRIDDSGGVIRLMGAEGVVRSSGVLDASAGDAASAGGRVEVLGEHVGLFGDALVDVSGATDGGVALIGGDYQGANAEIINATRTYIGSDATIKADAGQQGEGGRVIVWSDEVTRYGGHISARGGALQGDGGFAEVSGKQSLVFRGSADVAAASGSGGTLLLDPENITIDASATTDADFADGTYAFAENDGNDATIGNEAIENFLGAGTSVVLQAANDITQLAGADIDVAGVSGAAGQSLTLEAGNDIVLNGDISTNNGDVALTAANGVALVGLITTAGGDVLITANGADILMQDGASIDVGAGDVTFTAEQNARLTQITSSGTVSVTATLGALTNDGDDTTRIVADALTLTAGTSIGASVDGAIDTDVDALTAAAGNGDVHIGELDGLTLTSVSAAGAGSDVGITSATGNIEVGSVTALDAVTLNATAGSIVDDLDDTTRVTADTVTLTAGTSIGGAGAAAQIDTDVGSLTATAGNGGVYLAEVDGLTLTNVSSSAGGDVNVSTAGSIVATTVNAGGNVSLTSSAGDIQAGAITAAGNAALTASAGAINDDANNGTRIAANGLTLSAGTSIGADANGPVDTNVGSLTASAGNGGVQISELNGLTLTSVSAAGAGSDVGITSATGNIVVESVTASDAVSLSATTGSIVDDSDDTTRVVGNALTLNAGTSIGAALLNAQIDTDVSSLAATAGAGGIYVGELNDLTLTNVSATGGDVNVIAADDIVATIVGASGSVSLASTAGDIEAGAITAGGNATLTATAGAIADDGDNGTRVAANGLTLSAGTSIGAGANGPVDTNVGSLTATATNGGVQIAESNGLTLTSVSAAGAGSDVGITSATGNIEVGSVTALDAVTLNATAGSIVDDLDDTTRVTADTVTLTAGTSIGGAGAAAQIDTDVGSLTATAGNGGVYLAEVDDLTLTNVSSSAGGDVNVSTAGSIVATTVNAGGNVSLTSSAGDIQAGAITAAGNAALTASAGAINDDANNGTRIAANGLTLSAGTSIGVGANGSIDTNATSLAADAGAGGVHINELNGLTLANVGATGGDVNVSNAAGNIVATIVGASGNVSLTSSAGNIEARTITAGGNATLTTTAGAITDDANNGTRIAANGLTLSAGTSIGAGANGSLDTDVSSLTASAGDGGVHIAELNGLTLTSVSAAGVGSDVSITSATGNIAVVAVTASDDVTLSAATGAIVDDANDATRIAANALTLNAGTSIGVAGANGEMDTEVSSLSAAAGNGGVYVSEANGLTLASATAAGAGSGINVSTATGDIVVGAVVAPGAVVLTANGGAITDDDNDASAIEAGTVSLSAATSVGTIVDFGAADHGDVGSSVDVRTNGALSAVVASNSGQLNLNLLGAPTLAPGAVVVGSGPNRAGSVVLQSAGDLDLTGLSPGAIEIGVGSATRVGLRSGGVLTLSSAGSVTDQPAARLLLSGSDDIVDSDATPRQFALAAQSLDFRSGAAGGATTLNTAVAQLDATIGAGQDLIVNEANAVVLGAIDALGGAFTLSAGGAVTDDGNDATSISANAATVSGTALGASGNALTTDVAVLNASSSAGGIYVNDANALSISATATGGIVDVQAGGAMTVGTISGDGVALTAGAPGSAITLNGAIDGRAGNVALTAGTAADRGAIVSGAGASVSGNSLAAVADSIGSTGARLSTKVASLAATATNGGMFVTETDALTLTASSTGGVTDVRTLNGALTVAAASGDGVTLTAGGAASAINVNGVVDAGAFDAMLVAGTSGNRGAIIGGAAGEVRGDVLAVVGASIGTSGARLNTTVNALEATSESGGIFVTETDALALTASAVGGGVDVRTDDGAIAVSALSGTGATLTAGGAGSGITIEGSLDVGAGNAVLTAGTAANRGSIMTGSSGQISASALTATGSSIGSDAARLSTNVGTLSLSSGGGGIYVNEADDVTLDASATGGAVDVRTIDGAIAVTAANGNAISLTANGAGNAIAINGAVNAGTGEVSLIAGSAQSRGAIEAGSGNRINASVLDVSASAIGSNGARLNTAIDSLTADLSSGGLHLNEQNGLTLANVSAPGQVSIASASGDITVSTIDAGGAVALTASSGAILDDGDDATLLSGNALTLRAHSVGEASTLTNGVLDSSRRLDIDADTLDASASAGGVYIDSANGLGNVRIDASGEGAGDIELLARNGDLGVRSVNASDTVLLAAGRNIVAEPGATPIVARSAELRAGASDAAAGRIGTLTAPLEMQLSAGASLRLFVPHTVDPEDPDTGPAVLLSPGVNATVNKFTAPSALAVQAGFGQFIGQGDAQFTSPVEVLLRTLQSQTGTADTNLEIDWVSFDPEVSLFGTLEPAVCLPSDQRDEEEGSGGC